MDSELIDIFSKLIQQALLPFQRAQWKKHTISLLQKRPNANFKLVDLNSDLLWILISTPWSDLRPIIPLLV